VCRFIHADEQRFRLVWTNLKSMMEQVLVEQQKAQMRTTRESVPNTNPVRIIKVRRDCHCKESKQRLILLNSLNSK
jgi:hypothetical protein